MPNMLDYLTWRGDLPLACVPWNEVDSLLMASLSYCSFGEQAAGDVGVALRSLSPGPREDVKDFRFFNRCRDLEGALAQTLRFGGLMVHDAVELLEPLRQMQFAAMTIDLPDGDCFIAYRGTDSTLVGWRENFAMAYDDAVPAQQEALTYLERISLRHPRGIYLGGHSKGGNLAVFAAAHASEPARRLLRGVYSFDGPGLSQKVLETPGYASIHGLIRSYLPQSSVVGLLLGYHPEYTVVRAEAVSLLQHDPFTWQLTGPRFEEMQQVDAASQLMDETLHEWLEHCTPMQREAFVDAVFSILEATGATTLSQIKDEKFRSVAAMVIAGLTLDSETKKMLIRLVAQFIRIGTTNLWERLRQRPLALRGRTDDAENEWEVES
ncbi:MAG: DUF2974 domain-containing protein [Clostridiales bacterium]|nr:DUF2974 domain-containing protein [Clostridiales bacterium]